MPSQEATSAAVLNAAPLSLLLSMLFMVVVAMCGPSAICVPEVMIRGEKQLPSDNLDPDSNSFPAQHVPISDADFEAPWMPAAAAAVGMTAKRGML